jgi:exodeoxyribonuclease-5
MLKDHIISLLRKNFDYPPTQSQLRLIDQLGEHISLPAGKDVFVIKGYAGTGKTTMVSSLVATFDSFRIGYVLLAPTGRAAKVLSSYSGRQAYTIHKKIYRQKSAKDGVGEFVLDRNLHTGTYFIVDEASMITNQAQENTLFGTGRLLDDLITYVFNQKKCRLILIGDTAQLPPVGLDMSPALDLKVLGKLGLRAGEFFLDDVIRQSGDSGILTIATTLRQNLSEGHIARPEFYLSGFTDVQNITGEYLIEEIRTSYEQYGTGGTVIITRSNKRANRFNMAIRSQILERQVPIEKGDFLMIVKNNYFWKDEDETLDFIANGDMAEITRILGFQDRYGYHFADVELRFPDYGDVYVRATIILDSLLSESASLSAEEGRILYQNIAADFPEIRSKKKKYEAIRNHAYYNALQVKFAYAVTCHKAQGGQWKSVFVDQGYVSDEMVNREYYRWLYTAFTRATDKLWLVNFP